MQAQIYAKFYICNILQKAYKIYFENYYCSKIITFFKNYS